VSIQQAAARALAAVNHARSLFASSPEPLPGGAPLESAADSTVGAGQRMSGLSGALVDRHGDFVGEQATRLSYAGHMDATLASHLRDASLLTQDGARQLDTIVDRTRSLAAAAATARTPADQRTVLAGLRSAVSAADDVVTSTRQQAGGIAGDIRGLDYGTPGRMRTAGFGRDGAPEDPPPRPKKDPDQEARERDERIAADPAADPTARRLAQERLNDLKYAKFIGPLTTDPIMGGDARSRAQARQMFQRMMESGEAFPDRPPLTPDEATRLLDRWESQSRDMVLGHFASQLQAAGVSQEGIGRALDRVRNGQSPGQLIHDALSGASTYGGALGGGAEAHGGALPSGRHWGDAPVWSESDAKALEGFGRKLGAAGVGLDSVLTLNDIADGTDPGDALAKLGGRSAGGWLGGAIAGGAWGSLVGPEGTLIVGFLGALAGAWGGDKAVDWMLGH
jgi:hypothetical protein